MANAGEHWTFTLPPDGLAFPDELVSLVWSYFEWDRTHNRDEWAHPRSREQLSRFIGDAYQASLRSEEDRAVRLQEVFDLNPSQITVRFERPLPYNVGQLIKLSPTIGIGYRWLVVAPVDPDRDELEIVGICDPNLSPNPTAASLLTRWVQGMGMHIPDVSGIALSVFGPGWIRVSTWAQKFFELRDCTIRLPFTLHEVEPVRRWYEASAASMGLADDSLGRVLIRRIWADVISKVRDARHGGCVLVVPDDVSLDELPLQMLYRLDSTRLQDVIRARMSLEPALTSHVHGKGDVDIAVIDDAHFLEQEVDRMSDLCASLAAVDGSVVLHRDLRIAGFGAEILRAGAPRAAERVRYGPSHAPRGRDDKPLGGFGMRHRSAYRFCEAVPGAMAFVISQDGDVRVFIHEDGHVQLYEGPTPEDWIIA